MGDGVYLFEDDKTTYILVNALVSGLITKKQKESIGFKLNHTSKRIIYVSMFGSKEDFSKSKKNAADGTFVWFHESPEHYIHFDNTPSSNFILHPTLSS